MTKNHLCFVICHHIACKCLVNLFYVHVYYNKLNDRCHPTESLTFLFYYQINSLHNVHVINFYCYCYYDYHYTLDNSA